MISAWGVFAGAVRGKVGEPTCSDDWLCRESPSPASMVYEHCTSTTARRKWFERVKLLREHFATPTTMASKAVRSCAKKRKDATRSALATLEELENLLHGARDRLGKLGEQASEAAGTHTRFGAARVIMRELGASVEAVAPLKKVKTGHKALHISISKLGKAVDKEASELFLHS